MSSTILIQDRMACHILERLHDVHVNPFVLSFNVKTFSIDPQYIVPNSQLRQKWMKTLWLHLVYFEKGGVVLLSFFW